MRICCEGFTMLMVSGLLFLCSNVGHWVACRCCAVFLKDLLSLQNTLRNSRLVGWYILYWCCWLQNIPSEMYVAPWCFLKWVGRWDWDGLGISGLVWGIQQYSNTVTNSTGQISFIDLQALGLGLIIVKFVLLKKSMIFPYWKFLTSVRCKPVLPNS